jgi:hypothetical protein
MTRYCSANSSIEEGSIAYVIYHIENFLSECQGYTQTPPKPEMLMAFQLVQIGFDALPTEVVFNFIDCLQNGLGEGAADDFMDVQFGSDVLAFYYNPLPSTFKSLETDCKLLIKVLKLIT